MKLPSLSAGAQRVASVPLATLRRGVSLHQLSSSRRMFVNGSLRDGHGDGGCPTTAAGCAGYCSETLPGFPTGQERGDCIKDCKCRCFNIDCPPPPTICDSNCLIDPAGIQQFINDALSGRPADPSLLRFTRSCTQGSRQFTVPCSRCSPETRISLPWPVSDRCIQVCCTAFDPSSCSVSVREC
jgi:hypothetical protein